MADVIQGLSIGLTLDTSGIDEGMKRLKGQLKAVDSEMRANMSAFSRGEKSVEKYQTQLTGMNKKLGATEKAVNSARREHERMVAQHGEGSAQAERSATVYNNLTADFNNLQRTVSELSDEFAEFERQQEITSSTFGRLSASLETMGDRMSKVGDKMKDVGKNLSTYLTAPLAGLAGASVKTAMDFEAQMSRVGAIAGATAEEMDKLRESALELGASTSKSASEVAIAQEGLAAMGFTTQEILGAMPGVISAAESSGADMAQTADVMASALNVFGLEASEANRVADILAQTANQSAADITDMQYALKYAGGPAAALGVSLEELSGSIGIMTDAGLTGENAGTALRGALLGLLSPSEKNSKMMDTMGIAITDAEGNFVGLSQLVENLGNSMEGQTETQKAATLASLVGKEAVSGMLALMSAGPKEIDKMTKSLEDSGGASAEAAAKMKDNLAGAMDELGGAFETAAITIGTILTPAIHRVTALIQSMVDKFINASPAVQRMSLVIAGIAAAIGPALVVMGTMISMLGGMMTALAPLALKIAEAGGLLKYLRLGLAALTGPVGIAAAIIAALTIGFIALYKNSETFRTAVGNLITKVKELASQALAMLKPAIGAVVNFFNEQLSTIKQFWDENGKTIISALENIATVVGVVMKGIFAVIQFIMPAVLALIRAVWGNIKGVISGALDVIMGAVKIFAGLFSGDFAKMWEGVKQLFSGAITFLWNFISLTFFGKVLGGVKLFVGAFRGFFAGMWATLKTMFTGALNGIKSSTSSAWSSIASVTTRVFQGIWNFIKSIFGFIKNVIVGAVTGYFRIISTMWTSIFNITRSIFSGIFNFFKSIFSNIFSYISRIVGNIFSKVSGTWNLLKDTTSRVFGNIFTAVKGKFDDIVNAAKNLPRRIGDGIGSMASKVKDGVNRVVNNLASTLGTGINGVIGGINWVLGKIGIDKDKNVPLWKVPKYAHGTHGHPGGLAMVGDGVGSNAGRELIQTPSGELALSPSTETLINLPKGSQVLSAKKTKELIASIPQYANGIGGKLDDLWQGTKKAGSKAWESTKKLGSKAKDVAFDVWDYATNPGKLLNKALELLGISKPKGGSLAGNIAGGAYTKVKDNAISFIKKQLDNSGTMAGSGHGFGSKFRLTSRRGFRINPVTGIGQMHQGDDWGAPSGTLIPAQAAGKVIQAGYHSIRGNYVRVKSGIMDRLYQHNSRNLVKVGQNVKRGQAVGTVGSTGRSTGPHLHYEVRKNGVNVNPYGLETGGLVKSEQLVRIGEKNREEVVIPLHPSRRTDAMKLLALAGKRIMGGNGDKGVTRPNQLPSVGGNASEEQGIMKALLAATMKQNEILMQLLQKDANVYMDGGALVGAIGGDINTQLGGSSRSSAYMRGERL